MNPVPAQLASALRRASELASCRGRLSLDHRWLAIDLLERHGLTIGEPEVERSPERVQAVEIGRRCEQANQAVAERLRQRVQAGHTTPEGLRAAFHHRQGSSPIDGFGPLDDLVSRLMDVASPGEPEVALGPEMVPYQPTPVRAVLQMVERVQLGPQDHLTDLGCGLGRVVILSALLSGAAARGVEIEPAWVASARRSVELLRLSGVEIVQGDCRSTALGSSTVYFLFTPFRGGVLAEVLAHLRLEARTRRLRICTLGPCTAEVARVTWLRQRSFADGDAGVAVFDSSL